MKPPEDERQGDLVDCLIEDRRWEECALGEIADRAARATLAHLGLSSNGFSLCLLACDDARIAKLNSAFRGKGAATNVLSWPACERAADMPGQEPKRPAAGSPLEPEELGDIAIAYDTCHREAQSTSLAFADHVTHLIIHGVLHLLGYDHLQEADAALMEGHEIAILASLGIDDPYSDFG